jgi:hypothetical protein
VGRRWLPRRRRLGRVDVPNIGDLGPLGFASFDPSGVLATIALSILGVLAGVLLVLVLFNVVAIAIELAILVALIVWGVLARVVLRRPWEVVARSGNTMFSRLVVGWRPSRRAIREIADRLRAGDP